MENFTDLLVHKCDIKKEVLTTQGYETVKTLTTVANNVSCRYSASNRSSVKDGEMRIITDNEMFFFNPETEIKVDYIITFDEIDYTVLKVSKIYDSEKLNHLEAEVRATSVN